MVEVQNASGEVMEDLSGSLSDYTTDYIEGDKVVIHFSSDSTVDGWGYAIDRYEFVQ